MRAGGPPAGPPRAGRTGLSPTGRASLVPPHRIHQLQGLREARTGTGHVDHVALEGAEARHDRIRLHAGDGRVLMVVPGEDLLLARLAQEGDQLASLLRVV